MDADNRSPTGPLPEGWHAQVLDTAPDAMVVVGSDGRIAFVNAQTERMFGYPRAALLGQNLELLIPQRFRGSHGGHVARFFGRPGARPMGSGLELFGLRANGEEIAIEVSLSPVTAAGQVLVSAAIRDISERKRAEAAAKILHDRLMSAVESIKDSFALFDASDRAVLCNSVYRRLMGDLLPGPLVGRTRGEILDAWISDLSFGTDAERLEFHQARVAGHSLDQDTFEVRTKDGRSLRVADRRTVEGGIVRTIWDLTEDVRLAEELRLARESAEAASAAKSEFLSSMSHELRTPLNAILGFAQLLRRDRKEPLSERHLERVAQILKGGEHLLRLIDDILDLSRIEAGAVSLSTEPVGVEEVLASVRTTLEPMAARAGLALTIRPVPEKLPMIAADRTRFAQILMNFGSNAIKYNRPSGSVDFLVSTVTPGFIRVTVSDSGVGIPEEKQERLFQPFQRAGQETGPIEGTGIGLVITKRLAGLMGGTVGFSSRAGHGSDFWVELPEYVAPPMEALPRSAPAAIPLELHHGEKRLVLYVEDNPANVHFMRDLLGGFDAIELITAPTAEMGLELASARPPALIIMDINLPGISGLEALKALRSRPETQDVPVIALTAAASERDKHRGVEAGFFRYLTKPVQVDELETAIHAVLQQRDAM